MSRHRIGSQTVDQSRQLRRAHARCFGILGKTNRFGDRMHEQSISHWDIEVKSSVSRSHAVVTQ